MEADVVVNNLIKLYHEKKLAHAYLIETNNVTKCYEDVKKIIKGISCKTKWQEDCTKCNLCHLIDENNLPSLITIEPDGKNIKKDAIENLKQIFSTIPIYTDNNIYIIKYPEKMNDTAYNKMLKFLEEPEENIIGFFISENRDNVANTIVSRCELVKITYTDNLKSDVLGIDKEQYESYYALAKTYSDKIQKKDIDLVWYNNSILLKQIPTRADIIIFLKILFNIFIDKINEFDGNRKINYEYTKVIAKYLEQLNYNVNISLLMDSFVIEMGDVHGK